MNTPADLASAAAPLLAQLERRFAERRVVLDDGAQVAVRRAGPGSAPAVVLLHGIGSGAASWLPMVLALPEDLRVVAWDAPGYGASTPLATARPTAADYAERLGALLDACGVERCVLVGHSLGALVATAYAQRAGRSRVHRLLLLSPARGYGSDEPAARERVRATRLTTLREEGVAGIARRAPERMLSAGADATARAWVQWNAGRLNPAGYAQAVEMLCADDIGRHADLAMPVEVHAGSADSVTPPAACRAVAERLGARFELIADAGHASPVEQPARVAQLVAQAFRPVQQKKESA